MCKRVGETINPLFLNCKIAASLYAKLCKEANISCVTQASSHALLMENVCDFGKGKKAKTLRNCAVLALLWVICQERNRYNFKENREDLSGLWTKFFFLPVFGLGSQRTLKTLLSSSSVSIGKGSWVSFAY